MKQTPSIAEIQGMSQEDLAKQHAELTRKIAMNTIAIIWIKLTVPRVAAVCLKHAAIHAAKKL